MARPCISPLDVLNQEIVACQACPRLARYIREVAIVKRRAYSHQIYWGRPVPSFGDPQAELLIVGLAPGAHGANRTGRPFSGDRSGSTSTARFTAPVLPTSRKAAPPMTGCN